MTYCDHYWHEVIAFYHFNCANKAGCDLYNFKWLFLRQQYEFPNKCRKMRKKTIISGNYIFYSEIILFRIQLVLKFLFLVGKTKNILSIRPYSDSEIPEMGISDIFNPHFILRWGSWIFFFGNSFCYRRTSHLKL